VVTHDVPSNTTAVGVPARISLGHDADEVKKLEHSRLHDPIADAMKFVLKEQKKLEQNMSEKYKKLEEKINLAIDIEKR
jgi:serine O-acetyltransferase